MAKENDVWKWLRDNCRPIKPRLHMERVENVASSGRPDVNGCFDGKVFDVELKRCKLPKRIDEFDITWQKGQQPWLRERWKKGGLSWVLIFVGEGHKVQRFLVRGCDVDGLGENRTVGKKILQRTSLETLEDLSVIDPKASAPSIVRAAAGLEFG